MLAIAAGIIAILYAFGVRAGDLSLAWLAIGLFFLHFGVDFAPPWPRRP